MSYSSTLPTLRIGLWPTIQSFLLVLGFYLASPPLAVSAEPRIISEENLDDFREFLLEPLSVWITRSLLILKVSNQVEFSLPMAKLERREFTYDDPAFQETSLEALAALRPSKISAETIATGFTARTVLFESRLSQSRAPVTLYDFEMSWFSAQSITRQATGFLYREKFFELELPVGAGQPAGPEKPVGKGRASGTASTTKPESVADSANTGEIATTKRPLELAEVFRLIDPAVIAGFSQLLWRGVDQRERLFSFSPVIAKLRELPGALRSDLILRGQLAAHDLSVFGENLAAIKAEYKGETKLLMFFASETALSAEQVESATGSVLQVNGIHERSDGRQGMVRWNGEQQQFAQFAPWMPLSTVVSPRSVYIFQIATADPFTTFGKQLLFLDSETLLPLYKLSYSKWGSLERVVIGIWAVALHPETEARLPVLASVLSVAANGSHATSLGIRSVRFGFGELDPAVFPQRRFLTPELLSEAVTKLPIEGDDADVSAIEPTEDIGLSPEPRDETPPAQGPKRAVTPTPAPDLGPVKPELPGPPALELP